MSLLHKTAMELARTGQLAKAIEVYARDIRESRKVMAAVKACSRRSLRPGRARVIT